MTSDDELRATLRAYEPPRRGGFDLAVAVSRARSRRVRRRVVTLGTAVVCLAIVVAAFVIVRGRGGDAPTEFASSVGLVSGSISKSIDPHETAARSAAPLLLDAYRPPMGAQPTTAPGGRPPVASTTPDVVVERRAWIVPGDAATLAADLQAHPPSGFILAGGGKSGRSSVPTVYEVSLAPTAGIDDPLLAHLPDGVDATLQFTIVDDGHGAVKLSAYAVVTWIRSRTPSENVTIDVDRLVIVHTPDMNAGASPTTTTVTDRATIARVAALLNDLRPLPRGAAYSCPMDDGESYRLTFQRTPGDTEVAQAEVPASGCLFVTITIPGRGGNTYNGAQAGSGAELQSLLKSLTR